MKKITETTKNAEHQKAHVRSSCSSNLGFAGSGLRDRLGLGGGGIFLLFETKEIEGDVTFFKI